MPAEATAPGGPTPERGHPGLVLARRTARRSMRSGALWGLVFGLYVYESSEGYASLYKTEASRVGLARTFGNNAAFSALIGPAHDIQTVAGFTAWRSLGVLSIVGAVWGLLTATKLVRGEEDAGRLEAYLAGQTTRGGAVRQELLGLGAGVAALFVTVAAIILLVGRLHAVQFTASASVYLGVALVAPAAAFVAIGLLTSQLAPTRRKAAGYAGAALGVAFALRMVGDSGLGLSWLDWLSPLGWTERLTPLTGSDPFPLLLIVALVVACGFTAVILAERRDLGASVVADRDRTKSHTALLHSCAGLAVRLSKGVVVAWGIAIVVGSLLLGAVAKSAGQSLRDTESAQKLIDRLGGHGSPAVAYLGVSFLIVAVLVAVAAAGQIAATRSEESDERLDHLVVRPVGRTRWLAGRLMVATGALVALGLLAGVSAFISSAPTGIGVGIGSLLAAGLNVVPPALFVLGAGVLAFGLWPRATSAVAYAVIAWSFLVEFVGSAIQVNPLILDISLFHQMSNAPSVPPDWVANAVMVGLAMVMALLGGLAFRRRDLMGA